MEQEQVERIVTGLNQANVRYLLAGGLAVIAHGHLRYTADMDLILEFEQGNVLKGVEVFEALGYKPLVPVKLKELADAEKRRSWIEEKRAVVLNLVGPKSDDIRVDIFLRVPFDFESEWKNAGKLICDNGRVARVVSISTLIEMKQAADRGKDRTDIIQLKRLQALDRQEPIDGE